MKILIVSAATSFMRGGVPTETRDLVVGLHRLGHEVALACDVPLQGAEVARHFPIGLPFSGASAAQLQAAIDAFEPDFIHVLCVGAWGLVAFLPVLRSKRWALTVHSLPPAEQKLRFWHAREGLHYFARAIRFPAGRANSSSTATTSPLRRPSPMHPALHHSSPHHHRRGITICSRTTAAAASSSRSIKPV